MFSWMSKDEERKKNANVYSSVATGLQNVYKSKLLPLEKVRISQNRLYPRIAFLLKFENSSVYLARIFSFLGISVS